MSVNDVFDIFGLNKKPPTDWKKYYVKKPTTCHLKPVYDEEDKERRRRPNIELPHARFTNIAKDGAVIVGNMDVSLTHVTATADLENYRVTFMYVGTAGAWYNDKVMNRAVQVRVARQSTTATSQHFQYQLKHGDKICLQKGCAYQVVFEPPPSKDGGAFEAEQQSKAASAASDISASRGHNKANRTSTARPSSNK